MPASPPSAPDPLGPPRPGFGLRLARRILCCLVVLVGIEALVRQAAPRLDQAMLHDYRLPDVVLPPVRELAEATARARQHHPQRRLVGLAGTSSVWGYGITPDRTLAVRAQRIADHQGLPLTVLNLAMPRNRFADDRMVAGYMAGKLDLVLVAYSTYIARLLEDESCPSHLPIVEWSAELPDPFPLPPSCQQPERHFVNALLEEGVSQVWRTYAARPALRHLMFPQTQDFGRVVVGWVLSGGGRSTSRTGGLALPLIPRPLTPAARPAERMLPEIERLCAAYAEHGTRVGFYYMPSAGDPAALAQNQALLAGLERAVVEVARRHPECGLLDLQREMPEPVLQSEYIDYVHPGDSALQKLAAGLVQLMAKEVKDPAR